MVVVTTKLRTGLWRRLAGVLSSVFYSTAVALVLMEIVLRVFDPIGIRYYFDAARYFQDMRPDADFGYLHKPGYRAILQGVEVSINDEGLRGTGFPVKKPEGEKRLLILGDSVAFGWGAPQDSIFAARLQRLISVRAPEYRVICAAAGSWNTRTEYEFFRKRGIAYNPDIVVMLIVSNDVQPKSVGRTFVPREELLRMTPHGIPPTLGVRIARFIVRTSYVAATIRHIGRVRSTSTALLDMYAMNSPAWRDAEDALRGVVDLCGERDIPLLVFLYSDLASDFSRTFDAAYSRALATLEVPCHRFSKDVFSRRYRNSIVDGHPNAAGHRQIAQEMFAVLRSAL